jgi:transposase
VWANLSSVDRKSQRKPIADRLYKQGLTQEQIATQLGVSQQQISKDLDGLQPSSKPPRPKGGRPKGSGKKTKPEDKREHDQRNERIAALYDQGIPVKDIAAEVGLVDRHVHRIIERVHREAAPPVDPSTLSMSAQEKLNAALRQHIRQLDLEFEGRVRAECEKRIEETILPHYQKTHAEHLEVIKSRKGVMSRRQSRCL